MDKRIIIGVVVVIIIVGLFVINQEKQITPVSITPVAPAAVPTPVVATPFAIPAAVPTPVAAAPVAPPPTIALLTNPIASATPGDFYSAGSNSQDISKTMDGNLGTLWNPWFAATATSKASSAIYNFGSRKHISRIVIKSGYYDAVYSENWTGVNISCDGVFLKSATNNGVKLALPAGSGGDSYTSNDIAVDVACTTIKLDFPDNLHRIREIEFYGY